MFQQFRVQEVLTFTTVTCMAISNNTLKVNSHVFIYLLKIHFMTGFDLKSGSKTVRSLCVLHVFLCGPGFLPESRSTHVRLIYDILLSKWVNVKVFLGGLFCFSQYSYLSVQRSIDHFMQTDFISNLFTQVGTCAGK